MSAASLVFAAALVSTVFCLAVNAYTLTIGYPLWRFVGPANFAEVHRVYLQRLGTVITLPHILMFFSCGALIFLRPPALGLASAATVCVLTWATVAISAFAAGPIHSRFTRTGICDEPGLRRLVHISRARTAMMFVASAVLLEALLRALR